VRASLLSIATQVAVDGDETESGMNTTEFSRRAVLQQMATAAGAVTALGLSANQAAAQAKVSKKIVEYQDQPKGNQRCDTCINFQAPSSCKVVEGEVGSQGWCKAYGPKPS
jgi:hypothetical protein